MKNYVVKWHGEYLLTTEKKSETIHYGRKQKDAYRFTKEEAEAQAEIEKTFYYTSPGYAHIRPVKLKNVNFEKAREAFKEIGQIVKDGAVEALKEEVEQLKGSDARAKFWQEADRQTNALLKLALAERDEFGRAINQAQAIFERAKTEVETLRKLATAAANYPRKEEADKPEGRASAASGTRLGSQSRCPAGSRRCPGRDWYKDVSGQRRCTYCGFSEVKEEGTAKV